jgi:hypothetical protein
MDSVARSADVIEIDDSGDESLQAAATLSPGISTNLGLENASSDFESDDDTDEHNEVEQKPLIAPSTNIQVRDASDRRIHLTFVAGRF